MQAAEILQTVAEIAVALAGFGGLAAGLGYRAHESWSGMDRLRLISLTIVSLAVAFACLLPFAVTQLSPGDPWRMSSACFVLVPIGMLFLLIWTNHRGVQAGVSKTAVIIVGGSSISAALLLLIVLLLPDPGRDFGFYFCAILLQLLNASVLFVRLLMTSFSPPAA